MSDVRIVGGFAGWAIVELMGHRQRAGYAQEAELAGSKMLRVDVHVGDAVVTEFYSAAALYSIRPCDEAVAKDFHKQRDDPRPIRPVTYREPASPAPFEIAAPASGDDGDDGSPI